MQTPDSHIPPPNHRPWGFIFAGFSGFFLMLWCLATAALKDAGVLKEALAFLQQEPVTSWLGTYLETVLVILFLFSGVGLLLNKPWAHFLASLTLFLQIIEKLAIIVLYLFINRQPLGINIWIHLVILGAAFTFFTRFKFNFSFALQKTPHDISAPPVSLEQEIASSTTVISGTESKTETAAGKFGGKMTAIEGVISWLILFAGLIYNLQYKKGLAEAAIFGGAWGGLSHILVISFSRSAKKGFFAGGLSGAVIYIGTQFIPAVRDNPSLGFIILTVAAMDGGALSAWLTKKNFAFQGFGTGMLIALAAIIYFVVIGKEVRGWQLEFELFKEICLHSLILIACSAAGGTLGGSIFYLIRKKPAAPGTLVPPPENPEAS